MLQKSRVARKKKGLSLLTDIRKVDWPPAGYTTEILRLYVLYPHTDEYFQSLGLGVEEMAAYRFLQLGRDNGHLFIALHKRRVCGLLHLVAKPWASAMLNRHVWSIGQVIASPDAPSDTIPDLMRFALTEIQEPIEFISTEVPASDVKAIHGLRTAGFRAVVDQAVAVISNKPIPAAKNPLIRFVPVRDHHLESIATIARDSYMKCRFSRAPEFSPIDVGAFQSLQVSNFAEEPGSTILVAENNSGRVLGFIGMKKEDDAIEYTGKRLARIEHVGIRQDLRPERLEKMLHRHALAYLFRQEVDAVTISIATAQPGAGTTLDLLRRIGYRTVPSRLVMHCGHKSLARTIRLMPWQSRKGEIFKRQTVGVGGDQLEIGPTPSGQVSRVV